MLAKATTIKYTDKGAKILTVGKVKTQNDNIAQDEPICKSTEIFAR